ncbi:hypothetical protein [Leptospira interrogans]|uniref:hypothetical protein n=1 Tax=Leptospira interrogans TaxID=173 RepID=UPI0002BA81B6|nr:hypothetical protein [Leptospira interrogans]UMQ57664.1 hypothetical protein FH585_15640 [Leptospira interrogans]UMQ57678.1 hypothetical protein FH585_15720 [Leptospira interrogans]UMQ60434.1 hypothetical protein FH585_20645 [Leptospira interrogans]UMQ60447.1 hypothetical protein FH585_20725 [Leptospira interrogans]UNE65044.1 hypothetical protein FH588_01815 [Leptospira interrogans]
MKEKRKELKGRIHAVTKTEGFEEFAFYLRIKTFGERFEKMTSLEKREEVKRLLLSFDRCQKKIQKVLLKFQNLVTQDMETRRKLRVVGNKMRGTPKS